jgi:hypothetical protein
MKVHVAEAAGDVNGCSVYALETLKLLVFKKRLLVWVALASTLEGAVAVTIALYTVSAVWTTVCAVVAVVAVELAWAVIELAWAARICARVPSRG